MDISMADYSTWPMPPPLVWPGVEAIITERKGWLWVIVVVSRNEGSGQVGKWIDSLADRSVIFLEVNSSRLAGMLQRRGYRESRIWVAENDEWSDCMFRVSPGVQRALDLKISEAKKYPHITP